MERHVNIRAITQLIASVLAFAIVTGCDDNRAPFRPTGPTNPTPPAAASDTVTVLVVQPSTGSTTGATLVRILGYGFEPGATVMLGADAMDVTVVNSNTITATVAPYRPGAVDVIVSNPNGRSGTLSSGFSYVTVPRPTVTAVSPSVGSADGGTSLTISGADFQSGATVTLGGVTLRATLFQGSLFITTPPHPAGPVTLVVTNPGADAFVLANGYTYAAPGSFDFNGFWVGGAGPEWEFDLRFTVENNVLTDVRCGGAEPLTFAAPVAVRNGSFADLDGVVAGRILAASAARGSIDAPGCRALTWYASKQ